jgi:D-alanine-D-alanine ligase
LKPQGSTFALMSRPLIAVFRGGYSGESVISHQSADRMLKAIDTARFDPVYITVTNDGWSAEGADGKTLILDRGILGVDRGRGAERVHAALIAIHGSPGENGLLQGYLDMLCVPYQTGDVLNMAVTFSKYATVTLLRHMGHTVAPSILVPVKHAVSEEAILAVTGLPCFVKPDASGSSLGISKVKTREELGPALEKAFAEGSAVMVEAGVKGRELTCGVIRLDGKVIAMPVCEVITEREFFDYHAKYHDSATRELVPAPLPDEVTRLVQQRSEAIYTALHCNGMVRIDHIWTGEVLSTIEVNTTPGFSGASIFPKMLEVSGIGVPAAINGLIEGMLSPR